MEIRFKLNENNYKDKIIIDMLNQEYSATDYIKSLLFKMAVNGQQGIQMAFNGAVGNINVSNSNQRVDSNVNQRNLTESVVTPIQSTSNIQTECEISIGDEFNDVF